MNSALVTMKDIRVELGGSPILRGVSAEIERGKITALIGLNGSGKTTLLRCLLKEIPYQGVITFHCGHDHTHPGSGPIGYVPQRLQIESRLPFTVCDLLGLALLKRPLFLGIPRAVKQKMSAMLQRVWLDDTFLNRPVEKLSGGELQRVLLALALEPAPELLLLDEPASGIDFQKSGSFYELLDRLNRESGVTILLVSHDLSVVDRHAHHILCLRDGQIQCQGAPAEVLQQSVIAETFGHAAGVFSHRH
jgi:zinc transport system ATP-binding protein